MGLGLPVIALYQQLKTLGIFGNVLDVMELESQNVWAPKKTMMRRLLESFKQPIPSEKLSMFARRTTWREPVGESAPRWKRGCLSL